MATGQNMGFPKLLCTEAVVYSTRATVLGRAVPDFVFVLCALKMLSKLSFACDGNVAHIAVKIVRLPGAGVFEIDLFENSRDPTMVFDFLFLLDRSWGATAKIANGVTLVISNSLSPLATPTLFAYFFTYRVYRQRGFARL